MRSVTFLILSSFLGCAAAETSIKPAVPPLELPAVADPTTETETAPEPARGRRSRGPVIDEAEQYRRRAGVLLVPKLRTHRPRPAY